MTSELLVRIASRFLRNSPDERMQILTKQTPATHNREEAI